MSALPTASLPLRHFLLALAVVAVWGTNFVVIRVGLNHLPPLLFATLRFTLALVPMVFFLKRGDLDAMDEVFWCRVGTSGGVGLPGGTVVVTSEGLMADLRPYRLLNGGIGEYWFDGHFPADTYNAIIAANEYADFDIISGKTVAGN